MNNKIPDNVLNPILYKKAKIIADKTYKRHSAYKSMFLVKTYKELGGKYSTDKTNDTGKWLKQKWVSVEDYINGRIIECGEKSIGKNLCRPMYKQGDNILTVGEIVNKHGKTAIKNIIKKKKANMDKYIDWKTLKLK